METERMEMSTIIFMIVDKDAVLDLKFVMSGLLQLPICMGEVQTRR